MSPLFLSAFVLLATADFDAANALLTEQSYTKACEGFSALSTAKDDRETAAKKLYACAMAGKASWADVQTFAAAPEPQDFARAYVAARLSERQGTIDHQVAIEQLRPFAKGSSRQAQEAAALIVLLGTRDVEQRYYDRPRAERMTQVVLDFARTENERAHVRFFRAQSRLSDPKQQDEAEKELLALAKQDTDWADDATYALGSRRESQQRFVEALEFYDSAKRFSNVTANMRSSSLSRAEAVRRQELSLRIYNFELPGQKPKASLSWRNVKNATFTLKRVDPAALKEPALPTLWQSGSVVATWAAPLEVKSKHAPGTLELELKDITKTGAYLLEVNADGLSSLAEVLVTPLAVITKIDQRRVFVWVSDVETGTAQPNAEVTLFNRPTDENHDWRSQTAKADATGLASFTLKPGDYSMVAWAHVGASWSTATVGSWYDRDESNEELAYVMTDRPLYKPGEKVGLKVFLRSRQAGPSKPARNRSFLLSVADATGKRIVDAKLTSNAFGTATYELPLSKTAALGAYRVWVDASPISYQQQAYGFRVEEYKPPEYFVSVDPVGNPKPGEPVTFKVKASYFSGGPVANAQGRALVRVSAWAHRFGPWPGEDADGDGDEDASYGHEGDFEFGDMPSDYRSRRGYFGDLAQHTVLFKTGADGTAEFKVPKSEDLADNPSLQYSAEVFLTDASRREIAGAGSVKVTASQRFVDVRSGRFLYKPGEKVGLRLRAEDPNGRPVDAEVIVRLLKVTELGTGSKIAETRTKVVKGLGAAQLEADALGPVRVEVAEASAPSVVLAQTDLWLTNESKPMVPARKGFQVLIDRAPLSVGQGLRALVISNEPGGHALISIENEHLQLIKVVELFGRARFVELPLTAEDSPNAWLHASRFEGTAFLDSLHMFKVIGGDVDLGVKVSLGTRVAEPGSSLTASVALTKAQASLNAEVSLSVVDEALFALEPERQDFMTFFGRHQRSLSVATSNTVSEHRFTARKSTPSDVQPLQAAESSEAKSAPEMMNASALGRSSAAREEKVSLQDEDDSARKRSGAKDNASANRPNGAPAIKVRSDFGTSAGWFSELRATGPTPVVQAVKLTDSLTSWRAIATAVSADEHLGQGRATVRAAKPLMVRLQAPRFFIENDEVVLSAVVESHLAKAADVEVVIAAPGLKPLGTAGSRKTMRVAPGSLVRFDARFKVEALGERVVRATVKGGGTADAMEWTLPALVHGSAQRQFFSGRMSDSFKVEFELPAKRKPALTQFELVLTPSVLTAMFDALPSLAQYPYGCVEQTLSRFVPAVIARRTATELTLPLDRLPPNLDDMVARGLERITALQHSDGGWGWWSSDTTNKFMTAYVVYALGLAKQAGAPIDAEMLVRGRRFLSEHLGEALNEPETHAFMVFALSESGTVPKGAVDGDFVRRTTLSPRARALLALALINLKDPRARIAVDNLDDIVKAAQTRKDASVGEANDPWSTSAAIEATAFTLMAMLRFDATSPLIAPLTDFLVLRRNGGKWRTTRDTAFAVYALAQVAKKEGSTLKSGTFTVSVNGAEVKRVKFSKGGTDLQPLMLGDTAFKPGKNVIEVKRDASGTGYFAATFDMFNQNDFIKGVGGDVQVKRTYTLLGKPSTDRASAPTEYGMPVESGTRVRVDLDVTVNKAVEFVMIEDLKAAGFEAVMLTSGPEVCNFVCAHAELRTDRVAMFLPVLKVGTTRVSYELRAEVPGKFAALPARAEAMYAPELQATADEMRFEVRDAPTAGVVRSSP